MAEAAEDVEAVKVEMSVPIKVVSVKGGKVTLVMGSKTYELHKGDVLSVEFSGSVS